MSYAYTSDKRRRERMLPVRMMIVICESLLPHQEPEDKAKLSDLIQRFEAVLDEPVNDLDEANRDRLKKGVKRLVDDVFDDLYGRSTATAMRASAFLMQRIIEEGNVDLIDWPAFIEPYNEFAESVHGQGCNIETLEAVERSARKMAARQWDRLRMLGLYRLKPGQGAAA